VRRRLNPALRSLDLARWPANLLEKHNKEHGGVVQGRGRKGHFFWDTTAATRQRAMTMAGVEAGRGGPRGSRSPPSHPWGVLGEGS